MFLDLDFSLFKSSSHAFLKSSDIVSAGPLRLAKVCQKSYKFSFSHEFGDFMSLYSHNGDEQK